MDNNTRAWALTPEQALLKTLAEVMEQRDIALDKIKVLEKEHGELIKKNEDSDKEYIRKVLCDMTGMYWHNSYEGWKHETSERLKYKVQTFGSRADRAWTAKLERIWDGCYQGELIVEGEGRSEAQAVVDMALKYHAKLTAQNESKAADKDADKAGSKAQAKK